MTTKWWIACSFCAGVTGFGGTFGFGFAEPPPAASSTTSSSDNASNGNRRMTPPRSRGLPARAYNGSGALRVVRAPLLAEHLADLADGASRSQRLAHRREEVLVGPGHPADLRQRRFGVARVPLRAHARRPLELAPLDRRIEAVELDLLGPLLLVAVDADDHALARLDLRAVAVRRVLDLALGEPGLDRGDRPAELLDAVDELERPRLQLVRQRLEEEGAAERIGRVRAADLVADDLLRPERDPRRALGRERQRLVEAVRVDRLGAAAHRGERLDRDADDVVLGLLRGQRRAAGLG